MRVQLPLADKWTPAYQQRLNASLESFLQRLNPYALVPEGGTDGQVLAKSSDRSLELEWADAAAAVDTSDFVQKSTTMLGKTGPVALDNVTNTAAEWSNLPVGYARMMDAGTIGTAGGAPVNSSYGYFIKVANRDVGGGWGGIWSGYAGGDMYYGWADSSSDLPTWRKVLYDGIDTIEISNAAGGSVVNDLYIYRTGAGSNAVARDAWIQLANTSSGIGGGIQVLQGGGLMFWVNGGGWYNPVSVTGNGININDGQAIAFYDSGSTTSASVGYNDSTSYGSLEVTGTKNGYAGIAFPQSYGAAALMFGGGSTECGIWESTTGWRLHIWGDVVSVSNTNVQLGWRRKRVHTSVDADLVDKMYRQSISFGIPSGVFAEGDHFDIYNNSAGSITITQGSGLTLRLAGTATTGNRTLAQRGRATVWFNSSSEAIISNLGGLT